MKLHMWVELKHVKRMQKIHNSGINIFGVIPLCQFYERALAGDMCSAEHTN